MTIVLAVRGGLSAQEILGRTRGNLGMGAFYAVFVVAAAIHGAIGLRAVAREWLRWTRGAGLAAIVFAGALAALGLRAVAAVVMA